MPNTTLRRCKASALLFALLHRLSLRLCACLLVAVAAAFTVRAQSYSYNFESGASDFSPTTFTSNLGVGGGTVTYSVTSGIGNSGSFSTNGVTNETVIFNAPLGNSMGAVFTTSFYFLTGSNTNGSTAPNDLVGFGLFSSTTQLFDAGNLAGYKINGTNSSTLANATWYQLVATTTNTGSTFHTVISLQDYGSNGVTLTGSPISIGASDQTGGTLLTTSSVYVGIYGGGGTQGGLAQNFQTPAIDNFSISAIPEHSTYAAIAGIAVLGVAFWRRRQRTALRAEARSIA